MAEQERKYIDFDAMRAERKRPPIVIRIFGEEHELPGSMPALLPVLVLRRHREGVEHMDDQDTLDLADAFFGKERLAAWLKQGLTVEDLDTLVESVTIQYQDELQDRLKATRTQPKGSPMPGRRRKS